MIDISLVGSVSSLSRINALRFAVSLWLLETRAVSVYVVNAGGAKTLGPRVGELASQP